MLLSKAGLLERTETVECNAERARGACDGACVYLLVLAQGLFLARSGGDGFKLFLRSTQTQLHVRLSTHEP